MTTENAFDRLIQNCRELFRQKAYDYGASWRIFRPTSMTDQLFIKAKRIRSIEEKGEQKVADSIESEYIGIINYSIMALMLLDNPLAESDWTALANVDVEALVSQYDKKVALIRETLLAKNHDYGEAWRDMRITSCTDMILSKILRIKQIEDHQGTTLVSEPVSQNYVDIVNYAVFAWIKLTETQNS